MGRSGSAAVRVSASSRPPVAAGFRIDHIAGWDDRLAVAPQPRLHAISGRRDLLPLVVGFHDTATRELPRTVVASADRLAIDGTWVWLGNLACWLSATLVISVLLMVLS